MLASEAREIISANGQYKSADFYRMQNSHSIALAVFDDASLILQDVIAHGSEEATNILTQMLTNEIVVIKDSSVPYFNNNWDNTTQSQMAMQIAFPENYLEFFGGVNVWDPTDERFVSLMNHCVTAMANSHKGESDYYDAQGEMVETVTTEPQDPTLQANFGGDSARSQGDQGNGSLTDYESQCASLWLHYQTLQENFEFSVNGLKVQRDLELDQAREAMSQASQRYKDAVAILRDELRVARQAHSHYQANNKPAKEKL